MDQKYVWEKYQFRNPIKQNFGHVKALEGMLGLPYEAFIPIVVFSIQADLKVKTSSPVVYTSQLVKTIRKYTDLKIQREDIEKISLKISEANIDSKEIRKKHVQDIRDNIHKEEQTIKEGICSKCGGKLKERKGKYGTFLGCSNYPKCRYTKG